MVDWRVVTAVFVAIIGTYGVVIAYYRWMATHMANNKIHMNESDAVHKDVCREIRANNEQAHQHIAEKITMQEQRTTDAFGRVEAQLKNGFDLIRKGMNSNKEINDAS